MVRCSTSSPSAFPLACAVFFARRPPAFLSANDSPNYKIVTYDLEHPEKVGSPVERPSHQQLTLDSQQGFTDLIPHNPDALLSSVHIANNDALILLYSVDVKDELYLHELKSGKRVKRLAEGLIGSIDQIAGRREHDEFWYSVTSFITPGTVYRYDFKAPENREESIYRVAKVAGIDPEQFVSEQGKSSRMRKLNLSPDLLHPKFVLEFDLSTDLRIATVFYTSKDGTRVPMFITKPADVKSDGTAPAILYGYGGFSHSMTPFFSPSLLTWIKHYKGVLA